MSTAKHRWSELLCILLTYLVGLQHGSLSCQEGGEGR